MSDSIHCSVCGAENDQDASFCFRCGASLKPQQPATGRTVTLRESQPQMLTNDLPAQDTPDHAGGAYNASPYAAPATGTASVTNSSAIASLVLSILSFIIIPLIGSIAGIMLGYQARREIRASNGRQRGEEFATAGIVLGWIHIALVALIAVGICLVFAGLIGFGASQRHF